MLASRAASIVILIHFAGYFLNCFVVKMSENWVHQFPRIQSDVLKGIYFSNQQFKTQRHSICKDIKQRQPESKHILVSASRCLTFFPEK